MLGVKHCRIHTYKHTYIQQKSARFHLKQSRTHFSSVYCQEIEIGPQKQELIARN